MTARVLDGREVARGVFDEIGQVVEQLAAAGITPHLAFVMIGESAPAEMYAARLEKLGGSHGITVSRRRLPHDASIPVLTQVIADLNRDPETHGILIQMPLPDRLRDAPIYTAIEPEKDVDGITVTNAGRLYLELPGQRPSTAAAMMRIVDHAAVNVLGKHAVVVGRSNVIGHPLAEMLLQRDATLTVTHRQTHDLASYTRQADVLFVAAGEANLITADMIKDGAVIIDAGINVRGSAVTGDVDFEGCRDRAGAITPVPGGVGPVTNSMVLLHAARSAERQNA